MMNMVSMIIMVIMIFPRIRTRMKTMTMVVNGHHDYLGQHHLAQDQNQDLDYDEHGHHDH